MSELFAMDAAVAAGGRREESRVEEDRRLLFDCGRRLSLTGEFEAEERREEGREEGRQSVK